MASPIGMLPTPQALEINGIDWPRETAEQLLAVDTDDWYKEVDRREEFLANFATKLPPELLHENEALRKRLQDEQLRF